MEIKGKIVSGSHEGTYFMSQKIYQDKFQEKLGFQPYPGTLNLEVKPGDVQKIRDLQDIGIITGEGRFGDVKFIRSTLNQNVDGALIFPVKTHHPPEILEFIASQNIRKSLKLEDGDQVTLTID
jgi:riboflavin kinase